MKLLYPLDLLISSSVFLLSWTLEIYLLPHTSQDMVIPDFLHQWDVVFFFFFGSQYSWCNLEFCWPSSCCCTLSYFLDESLCSDNYLDILTETHSQEKGDTLSPTSSAGGQVKQYPSCPPHAPIGTCSADVGWYWLYVIHRSFFR